MTTPPSQARSADVARQLDYCTYCPKMCRHACPVSNATGRETFIPQAKMDRLNQLRRGHIAWSAPAAEPLWACTGCRQCTTFCEHGNEPGVVLLAGRARANASGATHPNLAGYPDRFRNRDHRLVTQLRAELAPAGGDDSATVGFWPGCDGIDKDLDGVAVARDLFAAVGSPVGVVDGGQACAGYPLLAAGYVDMFRWHASKVAAGVKRYRTLVVNCSACLYTMRSQYAAEGVTLAAEVLSVAEFLARSLPQLSRAATRRKSVYYHDPCYLARYSGITEAPRLVLGAVADVREFAWSHEQTECCGAGGLLPKTMPDVADAMARRRLSDIAGRGGGTVVTSCATCAFMLKRNAPDRVTVTDLPLAISQAIAGPVSGQS